MAAMPPLIVMFPLAALDIAASEMPRKFVAVRLVNAGEYVIASPVVEAFPQEKTDLFSTVW